MHWFGPGACLRCTAESPMEKWSLHLLDGSIVLGLDFCYFCDPNGKEMLCLLNAVILKIGLPRKL